MLRLVTRFTFFGLGSAPGTVTGDFCCSCALAKSSHAVLLTTLSASSSWVKYTEALRMMV